MAFWQRKRKGLWHAADGDLVIERGPDYVTCLATAKTLANDYSPARYQLGLRDAKGKLIVGGQPFTFIDDRAVHKNYLWYVYRWIDGQYQEIGKEATKAEAMTCAERSTK